MKRKLTVFIAMAVTGLCLMTGCNKTEGPLNGDWAYIHDTEKTVISLDKNGKAVFKDKKYSYTTDPEYIKLSSKDGSLDLRYELNDDGFNLYESEVYVLEEGDEPDGITGSYIKNDGNWALKFSENGTFAEGVEVSFSGHYTVDEDQKKITLIYDDRLDFDDTVLYYEQDGRELHIEYPTQMVKTGKTGE
ncbi:MAG: hypothetical protein K6G22_05885 [Lachnospiraceae bacterium]|nr:hypothetical protein [Lachnospiraceae bacterium]